MQNMQNMQSPQELLYKLQRAMRNQINDRFFSKENINQPVIATATKSFTSQSIILTTMPEFSADFLLQKKTIWEDIFSDKAQKIEKDKQWSKIVLLLLLFFN